jgi:hypothetical protein
VDIRKAPSRLVSSAGKGNLQDALATPKRETTVMSSRFRLLLKLRHVTPFRHLLAALSCSGSAFPRAALEVARLSLRRGRTSGLLPTRSRSGRASIAGRFGSVSVRCPSSHVTNRLFTTVPNHDSLTLPHYTLSSCTAFLSLHLLVLDLLRHAISCVYSAFCRSHAKSLNQHPIRARNSRQAFPRDIPVFQREKLIRGHLEIAWGFAAAFSPIPHR